MPPEGAFLIVCQSTNRDIIVHEQGLGCLVIRHNILRLCGDPGESLDERASYFLDSSWSVQDDRHWKGSERT